MTVSSIDKTYVGKIIEVGSAADPASRAFSVKIEVDNPGLVIRPGMIAEVNSNFRYRIRNIWYVPVEAIQHDFNDQSFVYVVDTSLNRAFKPECQPGQTR